MLYETQSQNRIVEGVKCKVRQATHKGTRNWSQTTLCFHCKVFLLLQPFLAEMPNTLVLSAGFHARRISGGQRRVGKALSVRGRALTAAGGAGAHLNAFGSPCCALASGDGDLECKASCFVWSRAYTCCTSLMLVLLGEVSYRNYSGM